MLSQFKIMLPFLDSVVYSKGINFYHSEQIGDGVFFEGRKGFTDFTFVFVLQGIKVLTCLECILVFNRVWMLIDLEFISVVQ
jgi:hypothetical protein